MRRPASGRSLHQFSCDRLSRGEPESQPRSSDTISTVRADHMTTPTDVPRPAATPMARTGTEFSPARMMDVELTEPLLPWTTMDVNGFGCLGGCIPSRSAHASSI